MIEENINIFMEKPTFVEIQIEILKRLPVLPICGKRGLTSEVKALRKRKDLSHETPSLETLNLAFKISIRIRTIYQTTGFNHLSLHNKLWN